VEIEESQVIHIRPNRHHGDFDSASGAKLGAVESLTLRTESGRIIELEQQSVDNQDMTVSFRVRIIH
jgi:hypothetical protein